MQIFGRQYLKRTRRHGFGDDIKVNFLIHAVNVRTDFMQRMIVSNVGLC